VSCEFSMGLPAEAVLDTAKFFDIQFLVIASSAILTSYRTMW